MATIRVERRTNGDLSFDVEVDDGKGTSSHQVTLSQSDFDRLSKGSETPEQFIERCFNFLLEREPKESILSRFDVSEIARYFPDFEKTILG